MPEGLSPETRFLAAFFLERAGAAIATLIFATTASLLRAPAAAPIAAMAALLLVVGTTFLANRIHWGTRFEQVGGHERYLIPGRLRVFEMVVTCVMAAGTAWLVVQIGIQADDHSSTSYVIVRGIGVLMVVLGIANIVRPLATPAVAVINAIGYAIASAVMWLLADLHEPASAEAGQTAIAIGGCLILGVAIVIGRRLSFQLLHRQSRG